MWAESVGEKNAWQYKPCIFLNLYYSRKIRQPENSADFMPTMWKKNLAFYHLST
jgi:hypothetical protein